MYALAWHIRIAVYLEENDGMVPHYIKWLKNYGSNRPTNAG